LILQIYNSNALKEHKLHITIGRAKGWAENAI